MEMKASKAWLLLQSLFLDGTAQEANDLIHAPMLYVREPFVEILNEWFQSSSSNELDL
jgi:hypothetical protein